LDRWADPALLTPASTGALGAFTLIPAFPRIPEMIDLFWSIGEHISQKIAAEGWSQGTVEILVVTIQQCYPGMNGYSARNL
jgi:hypothetical protein